MAKSIRTIAVLAAGLALSTGAAFSAAQNIVSSILDSGDQGTNVWVRYFSPAYNIVSPGGEGNCAASRSQVGFDATTRSCQLKYITSKSCYKGYTDNIFNDTQPAASPRYTVWDFERNTGAANHIGYYFFAGKATVTEGDQADWAQLNCAGTTFTNTCIGQGNSGNATGTSVSNSSQGTISPVGGFRPIPVPVPVFNSGTGNLDLSWSAASMVGDAPVSTITYDLYVAKKACGSSVLSTDYALLKNVTGTSTSVAKADLTLSGNTCAWFAIGLHYPSAGTTAVASRYLSANSLPVSYDASAATVTGLRATYMRNLGVQVTFKTTSESNTQGFYIARSFSANGPFVRVSPLIAAKGEANSYTYMDATRALVLRGGKVYYRVDVVSRDGKANSFGPVFVDIPGSNNRAPLTPATNSRFATQR